MEDDDEFGDLYTDVLGPLTTALQPQHGEAAAAGAAGKVSSSHSRPIDLNINSDDEEILYGAPDLKNNKSNSNTNPTSGLGWNLNAPIQGKTLAEPKGFDLNLVSNSETKVDGLTAKGGDGLGVEGRVLEKGDDMKILKKASGASNFMDDDDDINILVEERENKDEDLVNKDDTFVSKEDNLYVSAAPMEKSINIMNESVADGIGTEQMIPGLSGRLDNPRGSNFEDEWESDESEDDLQIVLNDNNHGPMGMERMPGIVDEDDEDGEPLVIVADNGDVGHQPHMMIDEQEWGGEEGVPGPDGEKDAGDAAKPSGGGAAAPAAVPPKMAYGNHMYHQPFHSQFKYVRPGAAPLPGATPVAPGGIPGQVRPPVNIGPLAGRGRGDWRPPGIKGGLPMQKGFHPGYGMPAWGANAAGRGYGSGLDFTLPSHKTIFEVDIDSFEEKPWKLPGIEMSDFFNFDLNEDSWKEYCKQLEQLRLATTMQSKIRVYESGRAEQDYDPDLPPELAAAVGIQDIPSDANPGKADGGPTDLARGTARGRLPLPVGRPIPVETGSGDRLPSIDTRRPRLHDNDAIIEIVCQGSTDSEDMADQQEDDPARKDVGGVDETHDLQQQDVDHMDSFSPSYNGQKRGTESRKVQLKNTGSSDEIVREDGLHLPPDIPVRYHLDRGSGVPHDDSRSTKGRGRIRSPEMAVSGKNSGKYIADNRNEESFDSGDRKRTPTLSSSGAIGSDEEPAVVVADDMHDGSVMDDRSFDMEREEMDVGATNTEKQKVGLREEHRSQEDEGEDSKGGRSSENNNKARSGSSKDQRRFPDDVEDEVLQDGRPPRAGNIKREGDEDINARRKGHYDRDETGRHNMVGKGREDSFSRRGGDSSSSRRYVKGESADWRKESDISEGSWQGRRAEDPRKRDHGGEIGSRNRAKVRENEKSEKDENRQSRNHIDSGSWKGVNHDHNIVRSRQRDDNTKSRNDKMDDLHSKRRKEEAHLSREFAEKEDMSQNYREGNSRRKRERDDGFDQSKRNDLTRMKDDDVHYPRQKEGVSFQRERTDRQRERDDWYRIKQDEVLSRREREETRPVMRSGRAAEDKTWASHSRGKDDYKGSSREYHSKRRDQVESESFSQHRSHEDVYAPSGNQYSNDDKRARFERPSSRDRRVAYGSDNTKMHEHKRKESNRKSRESESGDQSSKRSRDEHGGQITDTVRGRSDQQNDEIHPNRQSSRKHNKDKDPASSDDEHPGSRKGRSKLERWTSHKERDFAISMPSPSLRNRDPVTSQAEEPSKKTEEKPPLPPSDDKNTGNSETNNNSNNLNPEDKHLDTVAKLKKRSERFKLPMPSEKDTLAIKKMESEPLPSAHTAEIRPDSEIKSERPARKRRWISN